MAIYAPLHQFLLSAFSISELRRFVAHRYPEVLHHLPEANVAPAEWVYALVDALARRGLLDGSFLEALLRERPRRQHEIMAVAETLGLNVAPEPTPTRSPDLGPTAAAPESIEPIFQVFRTTGVPGINFVEPGQLGEIRARLTFFGEGLVVEGASGVGKTTAVRRALDEVQQRRPAPVTWIAAKSEVDVQQLAALLSGGPEQVRGYLVIDDFHHLPRETRRQVASLVKLVADASRDDTKVVLVGINPLGDSLVHDFHDLAGRFTVVKMNRQPDALVLELIKRGEAAANVLFEAREAIVQASAGSFYTAQLLCLELCLINDIVETLTERRLIVQGPYGHVIDRVRDRLKFKYHRRLVTFASHGLTRPARGAMFALLWVLREQFDDAAALATLQSRFPELNEELEWLLGSKLASLLQAEPGLQELFFYNREAGVLSAEDPQLQFYLEHISWPALARDAGLRHVTWDDQRPVFAASATTRAAQSVRAPVSQPAAHVLHVSDLHLNSRRDALQMADQLREDLHHDLGVGDLTAVVVSGDLVNRGTLPEYEAASLFFSELRRDFRLQPEQLVLVPGNHDLDWNVSKGAYRVVRRQDWEGPSADTSHLERGDYVEVARHNDLEPRFKAFANHYFEVRKEHYTLDADSQATLHHFPSARLLFLGLNSAWAIDHHHPSRADINSVALGRALEQIDREPTYGDALRIAVWHHPITSEDDDRIADTGFLERLAQAGFRLALHGHVHKAQAGSFRLDMTLGGRRLDLLGAGTFGAPTPAWRPGYPLQYQVLQFGGPDLVVHTRRREEPLGAWKPDARWSTGPGSDPLPRYEVPL